MHGVGKNMPERREAQARATTIHCPLKGPFLVLRQGLQLAMHLDSLCNAGGGTQGFVNARQELYQLSYYTLGLGKTSQRGQGLSQPLLHLWKVVGSMLKPTVSLRPQWVTACVASILT